MLKSINYQINNFLTGIFVPPFQLSDVPTFPLQEYMRNLDRYREAYRWFTGEALVQPLQNDPDRLKTSNPDLYPVHVNPLKATCLKHAYALFGESENDGRPLVLPKFVLDNPDTQKDAAHTAESALNMLWWESFGRSIQMQGGIISQILGGTGFYLRHVPWQSSYRNIPIAVERISPENLVCAPEYGDDYRLREAWIVKPVRPKDAREYGVEVGDYEPTYWLEHWELDRYEVQINGHPVKYTKGGVDYEGIGPNPFGFIPMVYIPHIRTTEFYGENVIDPLKGLVKELNLRLADYGDAVNTDAHNAVAGRNLQGLPRVLKTALGIDILDIGSASGISGNEPEPDLFEIRKQAASPPMKDLVDLLMAQYRRDSYVPAVADGEDEGSQRSAATLSARMWPLVSHIKTERINWTSGLDWLTTMMIRMMGQYSYGGITKEHYALRTRQEWAPVLPKDREAFVNELVNRAANNLGSIEHLLEMTGDVEDIDAEVTRIKEWMDFAAETKAKEQPFNSFGAPSGGGGAGGGRPPGQNPSVKETRGATPKEK